MDDKDTELLKHMIHAVNRRLTEYQMERRREEDRFAAGVERSFVKHNDLIGMMERQQASYLLRETYEVNHKELERRVGALEKNQAWFIGWATGAALVTSILTHFIFKVV